MGRRNQFTSSNECSCYNSYNNNTNNTNNNNNNNNFTPNNNHNRNNTPNKRANRKRKVERELINYVSCEVRSDQVAPEEAVLFGLLSCAQLQYLNDNKSVVLVNKTFAKILDPYVYSSRKEVRFAIANQFIYLMSPILVLSTPKDYSDFAYIHHSRMRICRTVVVNNPIDANWAKSLNRTMANVEIRGVVSDKSHRLSLPTSTCSLSILERHPYTEITASGLHTLHLNHSTHIHIWPDNLSVLHLHDYFNTNIDNLPASLHTLRIGSSFNQPIDHLPPNIRNISIGGVEGVFDCPVNYLPRSLTTLEITSYYFNQPIDHLPTNLRVLRITNPEFSQTVAHLPDVTDLLLEAPVQVRLPLSLKRLQVHLDAGRTVADGLPLLLQLEEVSLIGTSPTEISIPQGVAMLSVHGNCPVAVPGALVCLEITDNRAQDWHGPVMHTLPVTLTHLYLPAKFNLPLIDLPYHLNHISLGECFNQPLDQLPPAVTHIKFRSSRENHCNYFNQPLDSLPDGLLSIEFDAYPRFNQKLRQLPRTLVSLKLCSPSKKRTQPPMMAWTFNGVYPKKTSFNRCVGHLPAGLRELSLGDAMLKPISRLPPRLDKLTVYGEPRSVEVPEGAKVNFIRLT